MQSDNLSRTAEEAAQAAQGSCPRDAPGTELAAEPRRGKARKTESNRTLTTSNLKCNGREFPELGLKEIGGCLQICSDSLTHMLHR